MAEEVTYLNVEECFGASAGKVWAALNEKGQLNVLQLSKIAKMKTTDVIGALGWLAREGKITIQIKNRTPHYALK